MFRLSKWYFDMVTGEGAVLILYAARLQWGLVGLDYASVLGTTGGTAVRDTWTCRRVTPPQLDGDVLDWCNDPLHVRGRWLRDADPVSCTLADGPAGAIRWSCHMPRARATVTLDGREFTGLGYAEHLCLTIPPTRLPFRTLHWGRHLSSAHALVWIAWDDDRRWTWLDGRVTSSPGGPRDDVGGRECLRLWDSKDVRHRRLPGLLRERKSVSRSAIVRGGAAIDEGWAIHEVVTFVGRGRKTDGR